MPILFNFFNENETVISDYPSPLRELTESTQKGIIEL